VPNEKLATRATGLADASGSPSRTTRRRRRTWRVSARAKPTEGAAAEAEAAGAAAGAASAETAALAVGAVPGAVPAPVASEGRAKGGSPIGPAKTGGLQCASSLDVWAASLGMVWYEQLVDGLEVPLMLCGCDVLAHLSCFNAAACTENEPWFRNAQTLCLRTQSSCDG